MRDEVVYSEHIDSASGEYVKEKGIKRYAYKFWLRFIKQHFWLCEKCETNLAKTIKDSIAEGSLVLGNKDYEPPVELSSTSDILDQWTEVERRKATPEEASKLDKWE